LDAKDQALYKISQHELKNTARHQQLSREIALLAPGLQKLVVTGGEPLLDNNLIDFLSTLELSNQCQIQIYTGLGVNTGRLNKFLSRVQTFKNLYLTVSAEGTEKFYEFNRYGNSWSAFLNNVELLNQQKIKYNFQATLSNLTLIGFADFITHFKQSDIDITFAYQPDWMSPYVLDPQSKEIISQQIEYFPDSMKKQISQSMLADPTDTQKQNMQVFLREFVKRRPNINAAIYPETFLNWINYVV
jgi:MoaA/NifB/PqqE/SkfB family radical SAM enzyme